MEYNGTQRHPTNTKIIQSLILIEVRLDLKEKTVLYIRLTIVFHFLFLKPSRIRESNRIKVEKFPSLILMK